MKKLMLIRTTHIVLILLGILLIESNVAQTGPNFAHTELNKFFHEYAGLQDDEIKAIQNGIAVAKVVKSPEEIVSIFGSVYIKADPEKYVTFATDIEQTSKLPGYLAIRKFSDPPKLSDLDTFTLEPDDIKALEECKPDNCDVQLPAEKIEEFQRSIDWKSADVTKKVNTVARQMAFHALQSYIHGGHAALGTYRDKKNPNVVAESFEKLVSRAKALPVYLPDLHRYLLEYPNFESPNLKSEFHWEKVNFGLRPTLRIVQKIIYREPSRSAFAVAEKQLYSSHYFQTALDITVCIKDSAAAGQNGFYLITTKGSQQAGLTGLKGGIVRQIAINKSRSSLEKALTMFKKRLEQAP
ncbi:MAG TPA: hypothetical protein VLH08_16535 [Acidobacteriota bacterium]|nr:hypothetical protein [Acidobacteriota bacterium]